MMSATGCTVLAGSRGSESAGGEPVGDFAPALDLAQHQEPAVGRQPAAVEPGDELLAGNR